MKGLRSFVISGTILGVAAATSYGAGSNVPLSAWGPALPGMLTTLSLLGGAVLVRLARNAPITAPATFDEDDLKRFFETLEELSLRLFWIFIQTVAAIFLVIATIILSANAHPTFVYHEAVEQALSGLLAGLLVWLLWRLVLMARGDIGFLKLQRKIIENALRRDRKKEAAKIIAAPVSSSSIGRFGNVAGG